MNSELIRCLISPPTAPLYRTRVIRDSYQSLIAPLKLFHNTVKWQIRESNLIFFFSAERLSEPLGNSRHRTLLHFPTPFNQPMKQNGDISEGVAP